MEATKIKSWTDLGREDLNSIPMMREKGFSIDFSYQDRINGRNTAECPPLDAVSFSKGDLRVWQTYDYKTADNDWTVAEIIDGYYCNHRRIKSLEEL